MKRLSPGVCTAVLAGLAALIAAAYQLRFYADVGLVEEWGVFSYFDNNSLVFWTPTNAHFAPHAIRPFTILAHSVAYWLTPDSFVGLQIVQATAFGLAAGAMVLLLRELRMRPAIAIAGGLLFALFPAHDGSYTLRAVHMHWSSALIVVALWLLVRQAQRGLHWAVGLAMVAVQTAALFFYEAPYVIVALAPLLLLASPVAWRLRLKLTAVWYLAPLLNGIRIILLLRSDQPLYQESITVRSNRHGDEIAGLVDRIWHGALSPISSPHGHSAGVLPLVSVALLAVVLALIGRAHGGEAAPSSWRYGWIALGAFLSAPLTAMVFAAEPSLLREPLRLYSVASLPLTLAICAGAAALGARWRYADSIVALALVPLVLFAEDADRAYWHGRSDEQRRVLGALAGAISRAPANQPVVLVDTDSLLGRDVYALPGPILVPAVRYFMDQPTESVAYCYAMGAAAVPGVSSSCRATPAGISVDGAAPVAKATVVELLSVRDHVKATVPDVTKLVGRETGLFPCIRRRACAGGPPRAVAVLLRR